MPRFGIAYRPEPVDLAAAFGRVAALAASRLAPGGYLHVATDWQEYAEHVLAVLEATPGLRNTAEQFAPRPASRPETKFERRGLKLGHAVWDIVFTRESP